MITNDETGWMRKQSTVTYFKLPHQYLAEEGMKPNEKPMRTADPSARKTNGCLTNKKVLN